MNASRASAIILLIVLILACAAAQTKDSINRDNLMKLDLGMTKDQVLEIMGKPDFTEAYQKFGVVTETLYYYTKKRRVDTYRRWPDENIQKDECTPVVFERGKLTGWGDDFLQRKPKVEFEINR